MIYFPIVDLRGIKDEDIDSAILMLNEARCMIEEGEEDYVCIALVEVASYLQDDLVLQIRDAIERPLEQFKPVHRLSPTFSKWWKVVHNSKMIYEHEFNHLRLEWIDCMIRQLEERK